MIDTTIEAKRRQRATMKQLSQAMVAAIHRGDLELAHQLDAAIGRAMVSPEAAEVEQALFDQRDPH